MHYVGGEELIEILCKLYKRVCEDKEKLPSGQ